MPHFERKYLGGNKLINYWVNLHKISCYDKESLNSDDQQFHKYQQSEQPP
jgi:hypothetical protein